MYRGIATFTLDTGHCPPYLWKRMLRLNQEIVEIITAEYGPDEFIKRIADPVWFQALGTVVAFDWNASGLTTVLTGSLKEAIKGKEESLGIFICGGKGKTSRKTPEHIVSWSDKAGLSRTTVDELVHSSKMAAKVDSALIQDGFQLYHHNFFFSKSGAWTVVQQGMNTIKKTARRYHWYAPSPVIDYVNEPHTGIASQQFLKSALNMVAEESASTRKLSTEFAQGSYESVMKDITILRKHENKLSKMVALQRGKDQPTLLSLRREDFSSHRVVTEDFGKSKYLEKILQKITYEKPKSYEALVATEGVGPKTIRALSLVSEVIYGATPSYEDPARYSFAHGGKDGVPYPIDTNTYDNVITLLEKAVRKTKLEKAEKDAMLRKLQLFAHA